MKLSVYSVEKTLFEGDVEKVIVKTPQGEIAVLENHLPIITTVRGAIKAVTSGGQEHTITVQNGVLEVRPEREVVVLAN